MTGDKEFRDSKKTSRSFLVIVNTEIHYTLLNVTANHELGGNICLSINSSVTVCRSVTVNCFEVTVESFGRYSTMSVKVFMRKNCSALPIGS